jgi:hypothetical protein
VLGASVLAPLLLDAPAGGPAAHLAPLLALAPVTYLQAPSAPALRRALALVGAAPLPPHWDVGELLRQAAAQLPRALSDVSVARVAGAGADGCALELWEVRARHVEREVLSPPPPPRTKWTRRVPHPVLIRHAASLTPY